MKIKETSKSIILSLVLLVCFQFTMFAQSQSKTASTKIEIQVTKSSSDEVLLKYEKIFSNFDVELNFSKIERNQKDEITSIAIRLSDENGKKTKSKIKSSSPILTQKIYLKKYDDEISDLGIYTVTDQEEEKPTEPKIFKTPKIVNTIQDSQNVWVNNKKYKVKDLNNKSIVYKEINEKDGNIYIEGEILSKKEANDFLEKEGLHKFNMLSFNKEGKVSMFKIEEISFEVTR